MGNNLRSWQYFYEKYKDDAVSVCQHVFSKEENPTYFGKVPPGFVAGCCEACLYSSNRSILLVGHLFDYQPELVLLAHLPNYAFAKHLAGTWSIRRFDLELEPVEVGGILGRTVGDFKQDNGDYLCLMSENEPTSSVFASGARFFPIWPTEGGLGLDDLSDPKVEGLNLQRVRVDANQVVELALRDKHNYVCVPLGSNLWEYILVDEKLNIDNTLLTV